VDKFTKNKFKAFWYAGIISAIAAAFIVWKANQWGGVIHNMELEMFIREVFKED